MHAHALRKTKLLSGSLRVYRKDVGVYIVQFIVPTPLLVEGGRNFILNWFFFVQTILTDGHNHRTELRVVSLGSPSSVQYGIKKIFVDFLVFIASYRGSNFVNSRRYSAVFYSIFPYF